MLKSFTLIGLICLCTPDDNNVRIAMLIGEDIQPVTYV